MLNKLLFKLSGKLPARLIKLDDGPYLERYYIGQLLGVTVYLHRFVSSDSEEHLHNHPWSWGRALVLSGGYEEEVVTDLCPTTGPSGCVTATRRIRWWNRVDASHFHRIKNAKKNTWTLFMHGKRQRITLGMASRPKGWGFLEASACGTATRFTPFSGTSPKWWLTAPVGSASGREPLTL